MKIYTRKGDSGHTSLISGKIVDKHNTTVDAYGTIDELNSFIGLLKDYVEEKKIKEVLNDIQLKLFSIGSIEAFCFSRPLFFLPCFLSGYFGKNAGTDEKTDSQWQFVDIFDLS